jgi:hypothetical protein
LASTQTGPVIPGGRIAAHDVAFDEQLLRFLRGRQVGKSGNRQGHRDNG